MGIRTWTDEELVRAVESARSLRDVQRILGLKSSCTTSISNHIKRLELSTAHFGKQGRPGSFKYHEEDLRIAVEASFSVNEVLTRLGIRRAGGSHANVSRRIKALGIDTSHFRPYGRGTSTRKRTPEEVLIRRAPGSGRESTESLRRSLLSVGVEYQCSTSKCLVGRTWIESPITLQIDHIDGDWLNNELSNLRFLCPNCHSQTLTYAKKKASIR